MHGVDCFTDFESSAAALTVTPSRADLWDAANWIAGGVALVPPEHKAAAIRGALDGLFRILPPTLVDRRAVFHSPRGSEVR